MAKSRAHLLKELLPCLNALFGLEYARYENEHAEIYETETSDRSFEEEVKLSGFGAAPVKADVPLTASELNVPTLVIAVCAAPVTVAADPLALPVTLPTISPVKSPTNAVDVIEVAPVTTPASTLIVAPAARVIPVVLSPFISSYESIVDANALASIVVSLKATVVRPVALLNSLLPIAVPNIPRSLRLLDVIEVTLVKSTATVVASFIVFRSEADTAASSDEITIV